MKGLSHGNELAKKKIICSVMRNVFYTEEFHLTNHARLNGFPVLTDSTTKGQILLM